MKQGPSKSASNLLTATKRVNEFLFNDHVMQDVITAINQHAEALDDDFLTTLGAEFPKLDLMMGFAQIVNAAQGGLKEAKLAVKKLLPYFTTALEGKGLVLKANMEKSADDQAYSLTI